MEMERESFPDSTAEEFYRYLVPKNVLEDPTLEKESNHCIVFCKRIAPNFFEIHKGIAMIGQDKINFNDGICMIAPSTKVVFVIE